VIDRSTDVRNALKSRQRGFLLNPYRFGAGGSPQPLDGFTTGLWSATSYSHKMLTAYGGDARLTRRSSDSTTHTVTFSGNDAALAAEATFCAATQGRLRTSYDHSGNGNTWEQTTNTDAAQPRTVVAGVSETFGYSNAESTNWFVSTNASGTPAAITIHMRANFHSTSGDQMVMEHSTNVSAVATAYYLYMTGGKLRVGVFFGNAARGIIYEYADTVFGLNSSGPAVSFVLNTAEASFADMVKVYKDGAFLSPQSTIANTGGATANFTSAVEYVGSRGGSSLHAAIRVRHLGIHHAAVSAADIAVIHTRMLAL
jgi:hypothetical protein